MMLSIEDVSSRLKVFLEESEKSPVIWGESDCTSWVACWLERVHERPVRRPKWSSQAEARRLVVRAGSLESLWSEVLWDFGLHQSFSEPMPGDIGIIDTHSMGPVGGIFLQHGTFAWRAEPNGARILLPRQSTIIKHWKLA